MDLKVSLTYDRDATTTLDFLVAPGSTLKELAICLPRLPRQGRWRGGKWEGGSTLRIMYKNQYAKNTLVIACSLELQMKDYRST